MRRTNEVILNENTAKTISLVDEFFDITEGAAPIIETLGFLLRAFMNDDQEWPKEFKTTTVGNTTELITFLAHLHEQYESRQDLERRISGIVTWNIPYTNSET